jgi:NAD(P)-dependent dehydrogenase (short-subunit alcohol dehydrogenase family)
VSEKYLRGKHAIITGGGRGIGAAIAMELARHGATLSIMGRDLKTLTAHGDAIHRKHKVRIQSLQCDVSDATSIARAFRLAIRKLGAPYVLVNNAGLAIAAPFAKITAEQWNETIATNLTGAVLCTQQVLPFMQKADSGRIINIVSTAGLRGYTRLAAYCASKHGLIGVTRVLALELAKTGITVNAVCPGYTESDMTAEGIRAVSARLSISAAEAKQTLLRGVPSGKMVTAAEVASAVAWLCSPGAASATGVPIVIAGGELA